jgi:two-component system, NarL family, sensor histidine kinase UhpB
MNTKLPRFLGLRSSRRVVGPTLFVYLGAMLAAGWIFLAWYARVDRERSLQAARLQSATVAIAVSHSFAAMLHDGVGAAHAGAREIDARKADRLSSTQQAEILGRMLTGGDYVQELFVLYADTLISARRTLPHEVVASAEDVPPWAKQLRAAKDSVWVGRPTTARNSLASVPVARKIELPSGEAWVGAVISAESFDTLARTLTPEEGGLSILSLDGTLLMRAPDGTQYVGTNVATSLEFKQAIASRNETVFVDGNNPITGEPRMLVSRRIPGYPLLAVSGRNPQAVLATWRDRVLASVKIAAASSIALIALTFSLFFTLRRRYEVLRRSEERFQLAVRGTSDGIWDWNIKTGNAYFSPRLRELLCLEGSGEFRADVKDLVTLTHPDDVELVQRALDEHVSGGSPFDIEARFRCGANGYRWFRCRGASVRDRSNEAVRMAGSISDVHDRREAETSLERARVRELRAHEHFSEQLMVAQERERQRLANELHDSIGQNLSIIKNRAMLALRQTLPERAADQVKSVADVAAAAIAELRAVVHNLLPVQVEQLGLSEALRTLIEDFQTAFAVRIESRVEDVDDVLHGADAMHVFRIVQELVNNVMKHAHAIHCKVLVERDVHCVRIRIEDNGVGMPEDRTSSSGLGLPSIEQRTRMLRAQLQITSERGAGTRIHLEIPVTETVDANEALDIPQESM